VIDHIKNNEAAVFFLFVQSLRMRDKSGTVAYNVTTIIID
jgi:hypothetical protein